MNRLRDWKLAFLGSFSSTKEQRSNQLSVQEPYFLLTTTTDNTELNSTFLPKLYGTHKGGRRKSEKAWGGL